MDNNNFQNVVDAVNCEIINRSLERNKEDAIFSVEIINYINESLIEKDKRACLLYNRGQVAELMACNPESVMIACRAIPAMMNILRNSTLLTMFDFVLVGYFKFFIISL